MFGGVDYYVVLALMNGHSESEDKEALRSAGIDLYFKNSYGTKYPALTECKEWNDFDKKPRDCDDQGYFYSDDSDDVDEMLAEGYTLKCNPDEGVLRLTLKCGKKTYKCGPTKLTQRQVNAMIDAGIITEEMLIEN